MREQEGRFVSRDGTALFWRSWVPEEPRAVVAIVHGLAEHSGRYAPLGRHLAERGLAVYAVDYRGHGKSDGRRVHVSSFDEYTDDAAALLAYVKERHPSLPRFVLGHSQGGLITLLLVVRRKEEPDGAIVTSPLLGVHPSARPGRVRSALAALLERVAPALIVPNPLDARILSHDPAVATAYDSDPLVSHAVSAGWFAALREAQQEARTTAGRLKVPVLVMSSGDDLLVDPDAAAAWAASAPPSLVEYVRWDGLFHEMLNEPPELRAPVLARIDAWIDAHLATTHAEAPR